MELLKAMFSPPCLPSTLLLGAICLYWLVVIVGWMDIDGLDLDADWDGLLTWLGWRGMPLAICLSVVSLLWWAATMLGWHFLAPSSGLVLGASLLFLPLSVFSSRGILLPFRWFFDLLSADEPPEEAIDRFATLVTPLQAGQIGQAELSTKGASLLLNVMLERGPDLPKGSRVVVAERRDDGIYLVIPSSNPEIP